MIQSFDTTSIRIEADRIILPPKIRKSDLARLLGVCPRTVTRRCRLYGIKAGRDGLIRAADARRLLEE